MIRFALAVLAGMVVTLAGVVAVELFSAVVHPFPAETQEITDPDKQREAMCAHVANYPAWVLAVVVPMWLAIIWAGVRVAWWISGLASGLTFGVLLLAMLVLNLSMLPYPIWFKTVTLVGFPAAVWLALIGKKGGETDSGGQDPGGASEQSA